jgi:serine/threonine-protein kinase
MPEPHSTADPLVPLRDALRGRYDVQRELGRGGMGIVYLAHEVALDRPVALKLLPPELAVQPEWRERFVREAKTAARLSHPNILPIFAVDSAGEFVFFTMAVGNGETLAHRVRTRGPLPPQEVARVLRDIARAVDDAHKAGVIHRDLKAENVIVEAESERVLVMDFGIAHVRSDDAAGDGEIAGTVPYLSPEQVRGAAASERSDLYALGVLGYYLATGRLPFTGTTAAEILTLHVAQPAPRLPAGGSALEQALADAVKRCLAKDPEHRFQTAGELADALDTSLKARDELSVPLEAFVLRLRHRSRVLSGLAPLGVLLTIGALGALASGRVQAAGVMGGLVAVALALPVALMLPLTRRVLRAGHTPDDIVRALKHDVDRQREVLAYQFGKRASAVERVARWTAYAGLALFGAGAEAGMLVGGLPTGLVIGAMTGGAIAAIAGGAVAAQRHQRRQDVTGTRWLRFWRSRVGKWTARIAGLRLRQPALAPPPDSPFTESAAAAAAQRLIADMPDDVRQQLEDLPHALLKLDMRGRGLQTWIAQLTTDPALRDGRRSQLLEQRDAAERCLTDGSAALEAVLRELERLRAGTATVDSVSARLDAAREIGAAVDRILEGRGVVKGET